MSTEPDRTPEQPTPAAAAPAAAAGADATAREAGSPPDGEPTAKSEPTAEGEPIMEGEPAAEGEPIMEGEPIGQAGATPEEGSPAEAEPAVAAEEDMATAAEAAPAGGFIAEREALRSELDDRTRDLQRVSAEYANYRKRVERDRAAAGEQAISGLVTALLPVLDDLDRARAHDELPEGVAAVADQLVTILGKFGLTAVGEKGDPFDPNRHEAVAHQTSEEVSQTTCVDIMRRGYLLGDRLLRPAMVAVADPG